MSLELRPYQDTALKNLSDCFRAGRRAPVLVAPTGAGKTVMAAAMCVKHLDRSTDHRVVWLAHRWELIEQAVKTLESLGVDMARVCVESVQTLVRRTSVPPATLVIQDEAHHMVSKLWSKLNTAWPGVPRVGLTATPERGDGIGLRHAFDGIVVAAQPSELVAQGFLVPCRVERPGKMLRATQIAQPPVAAYLDHARDQQAVVFCRTVPDATETRDAFLAEGVRAALVTGKTPWPQRCATIQAFREGRGQVLVNVNVLTEGFDAPETSVCILARGAGTPGQFVQMTGRALRIASGKSGALVLDLRGISWVHGSPLDDREYSLDGKGIRLKAEVGARFCRVCSAPMSADADVCAGCGTRPPPPAPTEVTFDPLEEMKRLDAVPEPERIRNLAFWIRSARASGANPMQPIAIYKSKYKCWPSDKIKREAERKAR